MKRREFVAKGLTVAAAGAVAGCAGKESAPSVQTDQKVRWRLASSFPRGLDTIYGSAEVLAERVAAISGGNFQIRSHPAGEIVPGLQVMDAVQQGTVQVGQTASYYYIGKNPALAFDTCVPFGLTARQQNAWLHEGGGLELTRELFSDFGMINFPAGNTGSQMGGWFKRPLGSVGDLKGLKIRIPGLGGKVMNRLGATVQVIAGGEIYPALESGVIDATEWVGPYDDEKLGFHRIAKNYYYPGWWEPGPSLSFYVGTAAWETLSSVNKEIFTAAAQEAAMSMQVRYDAKNPAALARLVEGGVSLRPFGEDVMTEAKKAAFEIYAEQSAEPSYRKVYENWSRFRTDSYRWFATAELAYSAFAFPRD